MSTPAIAAVAACAPLRAPHRRHCYAGSERRRGRISEWQQRALRLAAANADPGAAEQPPDLDLSGAAYWDFFYSSGCGLEWMAGYADLQDLLRRICTSSDARVLHLGCGTSSLGEEMYDAGYKRITNIDISAVAVNAMRTRNLDARPGMTWLVADATNLVAFPTSHFDVVLDKGTFDAVAAARQPQSIVKLLAEVTRVLRVGGTYVVITLNSSLSARPQVLQMPHVDFDVQVEQLPGRPDFWCICCRKRQGADRARAQWMHEVMDQVKQGGSEVPAADAVAPLLGTTCFLD